MDQAECFRAPINGSLRSFEEILKNKGYGNNYSFSPTTGEKFIIREEKSCTISYAEEGATYIFPHLIKGGANKIPELGIQFVPRSDLLGLYSSFWYKKEKVAKSYLPADEWYMILKDTSTILRPNWTYRPSSQSPDDTY